MVSDTRTAEGELGTPGAAGDVSSLLVGRTGFLLLALLTSLVNTFAFHDGRVSNGDIFSIYGPLSALFVFTALSVLWMRARAPGASFNAAQLVADVVMVTGVVYVTGGPLSPLSFLFLPLVMTATIVFSRSGSSSM